MYRFLMLVIILFISGFIYAQQKDVTIGSNNLGQRNTVGGYFDYSDPEAINIKVSVWGFVKYPGRYCIPENTTVRDLLSYAGGPTDDANLKDLRLLRIEKDSSQKIFKFDYNELLWEEDKLASVNDKTNPNVQASDVLLVTGKPRLYFRDWATLTMSFLSMLASVSILIINIAK